jgi:predicted dehydrogenase
MAALRLGMIGAGKFAARHLEILDKADPEAFVVGHLSGHVESAEAAATRFGGTAYSDLGTFLGEARPDAVILTVPPDAHGPYEEVLIAARIPFLVEKPVGLDFAVIEHTANAIEKAGLTVAVGFNWRASDHMPALRKALATHVPRMVMGRWHGGIPASPWWRIKARSGGQFVEQAIHIVDLAIALLGDADSSAPAKIAHRCRTIPTATLPAPQPRSSSSATAFRAFSPPPACCRKWAAPISPSSATMPASS